MFKKEYCGGLVALRTGAFTLIEIIVAMTIIAVIAAVAVPTLKGLNDDAKTRAPILALAEMVQNVRQRAMQERRPYEIVMERDGVHAIPGNRSFPDRQEFVEYLEKLRTPPLPNSFGAQETAETIMGPGQSVETGAPRSLPASFPMESVLRSEPRQLVETPWTSTLPLDGIKCGILMWGDGEWDVLEGDKVRRWVFQANGVINPARVRLSIGATQMEAGFDALTGEMTGERTQPTGATTTR